MFSTRVTGLSPMPSGRLRVNPDIPELRVPSQKASISSLSSFGTDVMHSVTASTSKSSAELSHRSPNREQPMATTATLPAIPLLAIAFPVQSSLPEVVVYMARGEQSPKGESHGRADVDSFRFGVGYFAGESPPTGHVDDGLHDRRRW